MGALNSEIAGIMVIRYKDILELLTVLSEEKKLQATISGSLKGGLTAGLTSFLGGLLLGPIGLALGGAIGGVLASMSQNFQPVSQVIMSMPEHYQQKLVTAVQNIISNLDASDAIKLIAIIKGNGELKAKVMNEMIRFLRSEMSLRIDDRF